MVAHLSDRQADSIVGSTARINVWHGAVRSGKTISSIVRWLDFVARAPQGKLLMVGKTKDTLERNVIDPMTEMFGDLGSSAVVHTRGANTAVILGRLVHLVGANDKKAEGRIRGMTLIGAYVDEASLLPDGFWQMLLTRLSLPGAKLFATTNPDNPAHWLKRDYLDRASELDLAAWHFGLDDNPALDPQYVAQLKAENVGLFYKRFVEGLWVQAEGAIYETFDPDLHVVDLLPQMAQWLCVAVDYGTVNPFAGLLIGQGTDGRLYAAREHRHDSRAARRQKTDADYSQDLHDALEQWRQDPGLTRPVDPTWMVVDPSAASFMVQLHRDGWTGVNGGPNAVVDGIRLVASALASDRLRVHRSCTGLIDEFPGYVWDPEAAKQGRDEPVKADDHSLDSLRYGLMATEHIWRPATMQQAA